MNNSVHYKATIKMTSADEVHQLVIPTMFNLNDAKFILGSVAGKMASGGATLIHINCEDLRHHCNYTADTQRMDLIGRTVLSETVTFDNTFETTDFLGCPLPDNITHQPKLRFTLTDINNAPITNLTFIEFELQMYCRSAN